jgi:hypothetical protein
MKTRKKKFLVSDISHNLAGTERERERGREREREREKVLISSSGVLLRTEGLIEVFLEL